MHQLAWTLRASWSTLATFLIVAAALFAMAGPAEARILQLQPADESETPTLDFTDDQALFAIGTSDFLGGQICVVSSAITDVGDGSLNCDDAQAWGSPNQIITLGTFITPIESPSLAIGTWRLLGDGGSLPGQDALSLPFTVTPCTVCDPRFGAASIQYYKDIAARMAPPISDMCAWFNYMNLVGSVATGLRSGATLALNTVGSLPRFGALVGVPIGGSFSFGAVVIAGALEIPTSRLEAYLLLVRTVTCRTQDMYRDIMADPPDPNYNTVPQPVFSELPTVNNQLVDDVAESMDRQRAFGAAGLKAFERYQGADNDGNDAGVARQADAMGDRGFELRDELRTGVNLLRQWSVQLAADDGINTRHIDPNDPAISEIAAAEERLRASGFNAAEIDDLHAEGFNDAEIADLLRELKRAGVRQAPPDKTVMGVLDAAADAMENEADSVDQFARDAYAVAARITAVDRPPHATFTWERDANDPLLVHFDANGSSDPNGDPLTYRWDFHDGTTFGAGRTVSHRFTRKGDRIVTVWVSDGTSETPFIGTVHPGLRDPIAQFEKRPTSALAPYEAQFDASLSLDPEGKEIVSYKWDFGGGATAEGKAASHLFTKRGTANVFLTITTADGRTDTTGQQQFVLGMEDLDLPVCGDQGNPTAEPVVFRCEEFVPARGAQIFEVPGTGPRTIAMDFVLKLGAFANELAAFKVDDALGSIGSLRPGDDGYEAAAFNRAQTVFPLSAGPGSADVHLQVTGGDRFVFMLIPGGTLDLVRQNPTNDPDTGAYAFFSLDRLNPDRIPHTVSYAHKTDGSVEFGFEDLLDGGDNDFDDIVYRVTGLDPVPGLTVTKTADDPTSAPGESNGYSITIANGTGLDVPLESISDSLPIGFGYRAGTTSGVLAEPVVSGGGRVLRWNAPGIVPAGGSLRLHFDVTVANAAGEYLNEATAVASGFAVGPSGPTAKVTVEVARAITVTPVNDPPVAEVKRSTDLVLGCSDRRVVLEDVFIEAKKVRLLGVAAREFAGRKVQVVFGATGKTVAQATVGADGHFTATAPLPAKKLRNSNKARYVAKVGSDASLALKLARRMLVTKLAAAGGKVTIAGRVIGPLAARSKDRIITLQRIIACKKAEMVRTFAPARSGAFSVTVDAPAGQKAAVYRLSTRVRKNTRTRKLTKTFTLPRAVDFG